MVYAVAFLPGAALMGLEMVGSRVLTPVFGSSIFIWGSLIGVVLAALSVGYYAEAIWLTGTLTLRRSLCFSPYRAPGSL